MAFPSSGKQAGDLIKSEDWNDAIDEIVRLGDDKLDAAGGAVSGPLTVAGALGAGVEVPEAPLHVAGGNPDLSASEGDLKIGDASHRLKIGVALGGAHAGDVRIRAEGGEQRLMLGSGTGDVLAVHDGKVGIGTTSPGVPLHVEGDVQIGSTDTEHRLTVYAPDPLDPGDDGALTVRAVAGATFPTMNLRIFRHGLDGSSGLFLNPYSDKAVFVGKSENNLTKLVVRGNLHATGAVTSGDSVGCYITAHFRNSSSTMLEKGDVVVLHGGVRIEVDRYGQDDNIPVPYVRLSSKANHTRVCGIVAGLLVEDELKAPPGVREGSKKNGETISDGVKRLQVFTAEQREGLDRKKVGPSQFGKMVIGGCFATCKVDAGPGAIRIGDLLTTSTTRGHAQKVTDRAAAAGSILGKALQAIEKGTGTIPVLVMLQ